MEVNNHGCLGFDITRMHCIPFLVTPAQGLINITFIIQIRTLPLSLGWKQLPCCQTQPVYNWRDYWDFFMIHAVMIKKKKMLG